MDYKKTNAPLNTVTRDMIAMAEQTGNVYETVCIIGKRANQIAVEMKKELSRLRFHVSTRSCPNPPLLPLRNISNTSYISAIPQRLRSSSTTDYSALHFLTFSLCF